MSEFWRVTKANFPIVGQNLISFAASAQRADDWAPNRWNDQPATTNNTILQPESRTIKKKCIISRAERATFTGKKNLSGCCFRMIAVMMDNMVFSSV